MPPTVVVSSKASREQLRLIVVPQSGHGIYSGHEYPLLANVEKGKISFIKPY